VFHCDLKFQGDREHFDDPENSHLHRVLERRRGLPIMLSVLAVEMLRQVGLEAYGVALPGRYIARCETQSGPLWFDPFSPGSGEGTLLDEADCLDLARSHGAVLEQNMIRQALGPARNHSTLVRMLNNLIGSYDRRGMHMEKARTFDWLLLLQPGDMDLILSRGLAYHDAAMLGLAMRDYERYLRGRPQGVHSVMIRQRLESMYREHPQN
jgi:regulator of sirC expression with transglutaminase-like and TPR domain